VLGQKNQDIDTEDAKSTLKRLRHGHLDMAIKEILSHSKYRHEQKNRGIVRPGFLTNSFTSLSA